MDSTGILLMTTVQQRRAKRNRSCPLLCMDRNLKTATDAYYRNRTDQLVTVKVHRNRAKRDGHIYNILLERSVTYVTGQIVTFTDAIGTKRLTLVAAKRNSSE